MPKTKSALNKYSQAKEFAELYNVSERCISDMLKKSQKWLEIDPQTLENGVDISDQVLHEKVIAFASLYKVENFKGSNGWIGRFKKRHNLSCYLKQREAASINLMNSEKTFKI
ncbi:hypothetical protein RhiirA5_440728 [Rhizophagus irregularis]|uniref:HTH CENPB-type domain-containing protein n=1 Tax=Rhizophagus irregularis TaxID=588596 RepID=A0A2N0NGE1_9GLOM|nr:hypothetical protein RhiirA5_440728 [Rhizophagus irregularis]